MTIASAAGVPQHSGTYTPEVWSGKLLVEYYTDTVFADIANTDYEGEIKNQGDKVHIRTLPEIEIFDYEKGQTLEITRPNPGKIELTIDYAKYFNLAIDDIDKFQSDIDYVSKWTTHAGRKLAIAQDRGILATVFAGAHQYNKGLTAGAISRNINLGVAGTPLQLTAANIVGKLVDVGQVLAEQDVPNDMRKLVLPAWACSLIKKSELKDASLSGDGTSMLRNGRIGMIDDMEIFRSNSINVVTDGADQVFNAIGCHRDALTFAAQITDSRTFQAETTFGWFARSKIVYGFEVIKPEAMVHLYVKQ